MVGPGGGGFGCGGGDDYGPLARMDVGDRVDFKLADLLGRARYACFDGVDVRTAAAASSASSSSAHVLRTSASSTAGIRINTVGLCKLNQVDP